MRTPNSNGFFLWFVKPDGNVRRVKLTLRLFAVVTLITFSAVGGLAYVLSDYGKLQLARARDFFSLRRVEAERNKLMESNTSLVSELNTLKSINARVLSYERELKQRVDALASIIETASELGIIDESQVGLAEGGIGGSERNCTSLDDPRCDESNDEGASAALLDSGKEFDSAGLLGLLDHYLSLLKRVPIGAPGTGHISSGYGMRRSPFSGRMKFHEGVDFSLSFGSRVVSTADGVVVNVARTPTYGLMVDIDHGHGVVTRYAHLTKALVEKGQRICRDQEIAVVGSTGRSTGPHLHYEVRLNGEAQDPRRFIALVSQLDQISLG